MSARASAASGCAIISGASAAIVPAATCALKLSSGLSVRARPKSVSLTRPAELTMTESGVSAPCTVVPCA